MGTGNTKKSTYLSVFDGRICQRVKEGTEGAIARVNKNHQQVFELQFDFVEGDIEGIETKEGDYGKQWVISLWDGKEHFTLQLPYSSRISKSFLFCLPNIHLNRKVRLQPSMKVVNDKPQTTMFVSQDGSYIKWAYTKDNPNGLPPMEQIKIKGKETWDDSAQLEFLERMVADKLSGRDYSKAEAVSTLLETPISDDDEKNALPF